MKNSRSSNGLLLVVIILLLVNIGLSVVNFFRQNNHNEICKTVTSSEISEISKPVEVKSVPAPIEIHKPTIVEYIVKDGDCLSCIAPNNWQEIASINYLKNADLIHPGQKLKIPTGIKLQPRKIRITYASDGSPYCRIGADPVNPHREVTSVEQEYRLQKDEFVTTVSGSGMITKCTLHAGEIVVTEEVISEHGKVERVATWVKKCGNPILSNLVVETVQPIQSKSQLNAPIKVEVESDKPIILGIYENPNAQKASLKESQ